MNRRIGGVAVFAAFAVVWAVAIHFLWKTTVPSSLKLRHIDDASTYVSSEVAHAHAFEQGSFLLWVASVAVQLLVFALYAWRGASFMRESAAGPIGTGMLLGMLGFCLLWLADVPFSVLEVWWIRRYHVFHVGYASTIFGGWFALGVQFTVLCVTLGIVMGLARWLGKSWWLVAAPIFVGVTILLAFVSPYLSPTHPLDRPDIQAIAAQLEQEEGTGKVPIRVEDVSSDTSLPNAEAEGLGPSRQVVVWDTLLDGRFTDGEIKVVLAHELGHVRRDHIWKTIGWSALILVPTAFLLSLVTRRRGGMGEPAAIPLALFVYVLIGFLTVPVWNVITRHMEAEADWRALVTTRDPSDAQALFKQFVSAALSDPDPSTLDYIFAENHPTVDQRVAMARAWTVYEKQAKK